MPAERAPSDLVPPELVPPELVLPALVLATEDPRAEDVSALLERHLAFAREVTPAGHVHALEVERLVDPLVTFFTRAVKGGSSAWAPSGGWTARTPSSNRCTRARRPGAKGWGERWLLTS